MPSIHVVGIGLESELLPRVAKLVDTADVLVGSPRHLEFFPSYAGDRLVLGDIDRVIQHIQSHIQAGRMVVVLTSGDPLFFGLGRLLLANFPSEILTFHPYISSVQLAFNRLKIPWQDAQVVSAHGRSLDCLESLLHKGASPIAILTDAVNSPIAIASLLKSLHLPTKYRIWVCENLGGRDECVSELREDGEDSDRQEFAALNVVVLVKQEQIAPVSAHLPTIGIPDAEFHCFSDLPGLITKKEVRVLSISELSLLPGQVIWDIGAGTGSVAIEMARLSPSSQIFAIEKNAAGVTLIRQNCDRFGVSNVQVIAGSAPEALMDLPPPDRIFMGGSSGKLIEILAICCDRLRADGVLVANFASPEHLYTAMQWLKQHDCEVQLLQVNLARSVPIGNSDGISRLSPLNPVTILRSHFSKKYSIYM
ncbi:precorrin-6y C5,15-methyltransferase (decarboxylating) subunit CbiE [Pseudanabaena sp. PCC 6802]|uniref:precorrin-6y C5,15-methyltransferase (decarboxylating) subunit CbiE n=1 Tax=Pseudanabaena sp. PCC 6802 TaxID=118173 RepID=UPI00034C28D9|nr:precorrin-6y C5,15-methyltransferase (decarboxylating) subunit CbiE [Pseudanabaena sp. PCC 6802]